MEKIYRLLTERWLISGNDLARLMVPVLSAVKAGNIDAVERHLTSRTVAFATSPRLASRWELDDTSLPPDSVAVINLEGPLYSWETVRLERLLYLAMNNDRIAGVVLWVNGPGGMTARVDVAAATIEQAPKPIATYVAGTMASAHFWIGSAAARTFVASPLCTVGSVGVMTTYTDYTEFYKKMGIDMREIYPDGADLKNRAVRDIAERNDETRIKAELAELHQVFCQDVSRHLGVTYDPELPLFRGDTFSGSEAVRLGYIDQMGTLSDAVTWVLAQHTVNRANSLTK